MSSIGFLLDEHVPRLIHARLMLLAPDMRVYRIGDDTAPPKGTPDPDILAWIEAENCLLVTNNRASMPVHLAEHVAQDRHVPGIVQLPRRMQLRAILDDLWLLWAASLPGEFEDQIIYLPLCR
ncbi:MAG: DUF5615 family PIN-like protein [Ardenticatenaceae bacterium]|nr:DUF5615 family PIN-like protein [Ardenticatenaceae bacterium]